MVEWHHSTPKQSMTEQHVQFDPGHIIINPSLKRIDGNKIKSLDDVKKIVNFLNFQFSDNFPGIDDLKHLLTDTQEDN